MEIQKVCIYWNDDDLYEPTFILLVDKYNPQYFRPGMHLGRSPERVIVYVTNNLQDYPARIEDLNADEPWEKLEMGLMGPQWLDQELQRVSEYRVYKNASGTLAPYDPNFLKDWVTLRPHKCYIASTMKKLMDELLPMATLDPDPEVRKRMARLLKAILHTWDADYAQVIADRSTRSMLHYPHSIQCDLCRQPIEEDQYVLAETIQGWHHPNNLFCAHPKCCADFKRDARWTEEARHERLEVIHRIFSTTSPLDEQLEERKAMNQVATGAFHERTTLSALKMLLGINIFDPRDAYELGRDYARLVAHLLPAIKSRLSRNEYRDLRKCALSAEDWIANPRHYPEWYLRAFARKLKSAKPPRAHRRVPKGAPKSGYIVHPSGLFGAMETVLTGLGSEKPNILRMIDNQNRSIHVTHTIQREA